MIYFKKAKKLHATQAEVKRRLAIPDDTQFLANGELVWRYLIQREFPVCEGGGESKVLRSRTIEDRNQFRATPVKAWESTLDEHRRRPQRPGRK